jgi:hypothetical protein
MGFRGWGLEKMNSIPLTGSLVGSCSQMSRNEARFAALDFCHFFLDSLCVRPSIYCAFVAFGVPRPVWPVRTSSISSASLALRAGIWLWILGEHIEQAIRREQASGPGTIALCIQSNSSRSSFVIPDVSSFVIILDSMTIVDDHCLSCLDTLLYQLPFTAKGVASRPEKLVMFHPSERSGQD